MVEIYRDEIIYQISFLYIHNLCRLGSCIPDILYLTHYAIIDEIIQTPVGGIWFETL